jgi:hypothetical protein
MVEGYHRSVAIFDLISVTNSGAYISVNIPIRVVRLIRGAGDMQEYILFIGINLATGNS